MDCVNKYNFKIDLGSNVIGLPNSFNLEMVNFINSKEILPYTKLIGRIDGDNNKIVFGLNYKNTNYYFNIYDFTNKSFYKIILIDNYAYFVSMDIAKEVCNIDSLEATDYFFTFPIKIKKCVVSIEKTLNEKLNKEILEIYTNRNGSAKELINDVFMDFEHDSYLEMAYFLERIYRAFCAVTLFHAMGGALFKNSKPVITNKLIKKIIAKGTTKTSHKKFIKYVANMPLEELDELYNNITLQLFSNSVFPHCPDDLYPYLCNLVDAGFGSEI